MGKEQKHRVRHRHLSAAVLAGGESRRMGTHKGLVEIEGRPLITRIADRLRSVSDDVFVVAKRELATAERLVIDAFEERTPLGGIITALRNARHPRVFVCACDMPDVDPMLLSDRGVPFGDGRLQVLHAVWSKDDLPALETLWDEGERSVKRAIAQIGMPVVDVDDSAPFTDLDTPSELRAWSSRLRGS